MTSPSLRHARAMRGCELRRWRCGGRGFARRTRPMP
jgi:hypothetical protein